MVGSTSFKEFIFAKKDKGDTQNETPQKGKEDALNGTEGVGLL